MEQSPRKTYRKAWQRDEENPPAFKLQERDRELIKLIYEYRFLTSDQVADLFLLDHPRDPITGRAYSARGVKHRLFKLYHHGFLSRPEEAKVLRALQGKSLPYIYGIGPRSTRILVEKGYDRKQIKGALKEPGYRYLEHSLMVTTFHIALVKALKERSDWWLIFWKNEGKETRDAWTERGEGRRFRYVINPDAYFSLQGPEGPMFFFLEADRGTVSFERFRWKIESFTHFWREKRHLRKPFEMFEIKEGERKEKPFKVMIVTTRSERKEALRRIAREADPRGIGLRLFWFGLAEEYAEDWKKILEPIWQLADEEKRYSLLQRHFH